MILSIEGYDTVNVHIVAQSFKGGHADMGVNPQDYTFLEMPLIDSRSSLRFVGHLAGLLPEN
jgi:hypothetical protein